MADSSFGLKIGLEGEREFKRAITDINREMRVLGSEMKLVASSFDKNDKSAEAFTARNQVLGKEIEVQKAKSDEELADPAQQRRRGAQPARRRTQSQQRRPL